MLEWLILLCLGFSFVYSVFYLLYPPHTKELSCLHGPPRLPILGTLLDALRHQTLQEAWADFMEKCNQFPSPMLNQFGPKYIITMYDADQLEVLMKSSVNIEKSWTYEFVACWLGNGLLTSTGRKWQKHRKLLTPAFHFNILRDFIPIFNEQSEVLVKILQEKSSKQKEVDVYKLVTKCTLDIICETAMGKKLNAQTGSSAYVHAIYRFADIAIRRVFRPWQWNNTVMAFLPTGRQMWKLLNQMHSFTRKVIEEREASFAISDSNFVGKKRLAFLDLLLSMKQRGKISDDEIREEVDTFMFEGHDTTAAGIAWTMYTIGSNSDVQRKLHEELQDIFGDDMSRPVTIDDVNKMSYMECVIKETQRILPSVPMVSRLVSEKFTIPWQTIPKGAHVDINFMQLHRDPKHFPEPSRFDPDRFTPENSKGRHPFAFLPFSAGPRNCIGQKFAMLEEKIVLANILRKFRLESTQSYDELKIAMQLVLRPMEGLWLRLYEKY